ncbi:MAG: arsenate reductase [Bacteroidia bacterium]|jgi:arsenate reductase
MHRKSTISTAPEISIMYNLNCSKAKKALAYAKSVTKSVFTIEYSKSNKTPTQWRELLTQLNLRPKDLLDKSKPYYQTHLRGVEFEDEDWLNVIIKNPDLIRSPIAVKQGRAIMLDNPTDIYKI